MDALRRVGPANTREAGKQCLHIKHVLWVVAQAHQNDDIKQSNNCLFTHFFLFIQSMFGNTDNVPRQNINIMLQNKQI